MKPELYAAFERLEDTHWWFEGRRRIVREVLRRHLPAQQGRRILDVGCGTGGMFPLLAEFGAVEGAEASADARARAARRFPAVPVHSCTLGAAPVASLPRGPWHLITAFDVLEHLDDPVAALVGCRTTLTPGGQLVATVPAFEFLWNRHDEANQHRRRYRRRSLESHLSAAGFRVTWTSYYNTLLFPAVAASRVASRLLPGLFDAEGTDLTEVAAPLNALLTSLFAAERVALARARLPIGVSLVAVATPSHSGS